ncbi:uncharacterized protein JCM10292_003392 [Rhodotorula paludigena]|uniref:uncharacterized protein n=1 Tax=Rhodotorula paludigena TaxID=86838 RepID=UPI003176DC1E
MAEHNGPRRWLGREGGLSVSQLLGPSDAETTPARGAEPPAVTVTHAEQDHVYLWDQGENIPHGLHHLSREPYVRLDRSHSAAQALDKIGLQHHTEFFVAWFRQWCLPRFRGIDWTYEAYVPLFDTGHGTRSSPYEIAVPALLYPARWSSSDSWFLTRELKSPHEVAAPGYYALVNVHGERQTMAAADAWQTGRMSAFGHR